MSESITNQVSKKQPIIPNLWFNDNGSEAIELYKRVFAHVEIHRTEYYTKAGKEEHGHNAGDTLTILFSIEGFYFVALNGGAPFRPNPSISFMVTVNSKEEVDRIWNILSEGGETLMPLDSYPFNEHYGWLNDQYGVSWQIGYDETAESARITPSLLFVKEQAGNAKPALEYYTSLFPDSKIEMTSEYGEGAEPNQPDWINYGVASVIGQHIIAMDSALEHTFHFDEGVSLMVTFDTQEEVDHYWDELTKDGEESVCGWLKDKFGVNWQIVPAEFNEMYETGTPAQVEALTVAFMKMRKLDARELRKVFNEN